MRARICRRADESGHQAVAPFTLGAYGPTMQMTSDRQRRIMSVIAVMLVATLFGIAASLTQDDRRTFGTIGLFLQVVGAAGMALGLGLMMWQRRRERAQRH